MNLSSLKVSTKLYGGFSIPVILMLVIVTFSQIELTEIQNNLERIVTVNNVRGELANDTAQLVRDISLRLRDILLVQDMDVKNNCPPHQYRGTCIDETYSSPGPKARPGKI